MKKDVGLRIRVEQQLRKQFVDVCRAEDKPAAQVIREFMRSYVAQNPAANDRGQPQLTRKAVKKGGPR